ncbi:MFS transporter, partial [Salmonella enterica]|nr:MFS transporter [Salmonella enterica]
GWLSDQIGRKRTYIIGGFGLIAWLPFYFPMLNSGDFWVVLSGIVLGLCLQALCYGPQGALLGEIFPTRMRYQGSSFTYQVTSILAGSLAP